MCGLGITWGLMFNWSLVSTWNLFINWEPDVHLVPDVHLETGVQLGTAIPDSVNLVFDVQYSPGTVHLRPDVCLEPRSPLPSRILTEAWMSTWGLMSTQKGLWHHVPLPIPGESLWRVAVYPTLTVQDHVLLKTRSRKLTFWPRSLLKA